MQFHRSGQLDERRRRVLTEEIINSASSLPAETAESEPPRRLSRTGRAARQPSRYGDAVSMDRAMRITDLVPRGYLVLALWFFAGLALVGGLEALYYWMPQWAEHTTDGRIAAFDLDDEGSLATWFSSAILALCSLMALLVYSLRKHRLDDYHGRYRIWLWAAGCWLLMSIDEGSSLHEGFKEMMTLLTGYRLMGDGSIWWVVPYVLLLGIVGCRLLVDMLECRLSTTALLAAAACYAVAVATQLELVLPESGARGIMLEEGLEMVGNLFLLLSMTLHARYVILDAEGAIQPRQSKANAEKPATRSRTKAAAATAETAEVPAARRGWLFGRSQATSDAAASQSEPRTTATIRRSDLGAPPKPAAAASSSNQGTKSRTDAAQTQPATGHHRKLTKAERRALRRSQRDRDDDE